MTISYVRAGTKVETNSSATPSCPFPSTVDPDDLMIIAAVVKPSSITYSAIGGSWAAWIDKAGGAGADGPDTGPTRIGVATLTAVGTEDGTNQTVTVSTTPDPLVAIMIELSKTLAGAWDLASATGDDTTTGTTYSATMASDPGFTAGDFAVIVVGNPTDSGTYTSLSLTIPGCTVGAVTEQVHPITSLGDDGQVRVFTAAITAGTSTGNATFSASVATFTNAGAGPCILLRVREPSVVTKTPSDTASLSVTESVAIVAQLDTSDSAALAVTEAITLLAQLTATDTASLQVSESVVITGQIAVSDTAALAVTDVISGILAALDVSDTAGLAVSDTAVVVAQLAVDDTATLDVIEAVTTVVALAVADTATLETTESASVPFVMLDRFDTASLSVTESTAIQAALDVSDSAVLDVSEAVTVVAVVGVADTAVLSVVEELTALVGVTVADTAALQVSETVEILAALQVADTATIAVSDLVAVATQIAVSDIATLEVTGETATIWIVVEPVGRRITVMVERLQAPDGSETYQVVQVNPTELIIQVETE